MAFDPRAPYDISLDCFADVPEAERPVFTFRRLTGAEYLELSKVGEFVGKRTSEVSGDLFRIAAIGLIDWKRQVAPDTGQEILFDPTKLSEVIDQVDAFDLIVKRTDRSRLNGAERKNSESQS